MNGHVRTRPAAHAGVWLLLLLVALAQAGCVNRVVRTVDMTPPEQLPGIQPEHQLLDIGVAVFDPNVPEDYDERIELLVQPDIRNGEANFMPYLAKNLLESTGNWGAVRVVPRPTLAVDVIVTGRILHSDGESLSVELTVTDATGTQWFSRQYDELASKYAYDHSVPADIDPFQSIYKDLADDMLAYRRTLSDADIERIRATAQMKFARAFAPDAFADHIGQAEDGTFVLRRLPAEDDPMLARVRRVREREYLFIDTLDEYYESYHRKMYEPYQSWRSATYDEAIAYKLLRAQSRARTIGGTAAIIGGVAAIAESDGSSGDLGGIVGIMGGAMTLKSAIAKRAEAEIHAERLQEVGVAAEAEVMPHTIELENQVVRLQGSVEEQYDRLRRILREVYFADLDLPVPPEPTETRPGDAPETTRDE